MNSVLTFSRRIAMDSESISLSHSDYLRLVYTYNRAVSEHVDSFMFDGREFLTQFAKYLIEYYEMKNKLKP